VVAPSTSVRKTPGAGVVRDRRSHTWVPMFQSGPGSSDRAQHERLDRGFMGGGLV